jgi:hypothetical protein
VRRRRLAAGLALAATVAAGLLVHRMLPASVFADVAGDALYACAVYAALVVVAPHGRRRVVATIAAGWCIAVELFQATGLPVRWAEAFPPVRLVLGSGFDARDLVVYAAAVAAVLATDAAVSRLIRRRPARTMEA